MASLFFERDEDNTYDLIELMQKPPFFIFIFTIYLLFPLSKNVSPCQITVSSLRVQTILERQTAILSREKTHTFKIKLLNI